MLDTIGGRYLEGNLAALAIDGRLVIIGLMGGARAEIDLAALLVRRLQVIGSTLRDALGGREGGDRRGVPRPLRRRARGRPHPAGDRPRAAARPRPARRTAIMKASEHFGKIVLRVA